MNTGIRIGWFSRVFEYSNISRIPRVASPAAAKGAIIGIFSLALFINSYKNIINISNRVINISNSIRG